MMEKNFNTRAKKKIEIKENEMKEKKTKVQIKKYLSCNLSSNRWGKK